MARRQERIILVGTNGTGKSTTAAQIVDASTFNEGRKALALLPDDSEPLFNSYNELQINELKYLNGIANVKNKVFFEEKKNIFDEIFVNFRNGVLVMDDARFYTGASLDDDLRKVFVRSRQNNADVLFICHGLSEIPPSIITFTTKLILFQTVDSWQRLKNKIPNPAQFERYVNEVNRKANDHKKTCALYKGSDICTCGAAYVRKVIDMKKDLQLKPKDLY